VVNDRVKIEKEPSNYVCRGLASLVIVVGLLAPLCLAKPSSLAAQSCPWPSDVDIALAFCEAAHNDIAGDYPALYDVSIDVLVPPVILKAMGWYETWDSPGDWGWRQCLGTAPYSSGDGCAWGIMQVWTGMDCDHVTPFSEVTRQAVKSDYRYNVAMGTHILVNKWHERQAHQQVGNGTPDIAEHWYFAVWAYNSWAGPEGEYHGWNNNPNNPSFTRQGYTQNPGSYPYQEVVWWLAANPQSRPGGSPLWGAVPLTLPPNSVFPDQAHMHMEPWSIPDPLPTHQDWCRNCLPLVLRDYPPCVQLVQNGGFEAGIPPTPWVESGLYELIHTYRPHNGSYSAWLGGYDNANDTLYQAITIPNTGPTGRPVASARLTYYWYMTTYETLPGDFDKLRIQIRNVYGSPLRELELVTNRSTKDTWVVSSFDVSEFIGQTIRVHFQGTTNGTLITDFFVDDVSLSACEGG